MGMEMLRLRPGVNVELTASLNQAGYSVSNLIRFRNGLAEKLGGWARYYANAVGGVPKALHAWLDLNEAEYLGVGTTTLLGAITDGNLINITPQSLTSDFASDTIAQGISTTMGSATVVIDDPNISAVTDFDSVEFKTPVSVGGIILSGVYPINVGLGGTTYNIIAADQATATVSFEGTVPEFTTTSDSAVVSVELADHGLSEGDKINFPLSTTVGGVTISGTYRAGTITSADIFNISVNALASSSTSAFMNSGDIEIVYHIALGPAATSTGYSVGTYSEGAYSTGAPSTAQTGTPITSTDWTLDNWGEVLLACTDGGGIYAWQPNRGFATAELLSGSGAPAYNTGAFVSMQNQMLIAYGSTDELAIGLDRDPLLVKWCDTGDYTTWIPGTTSQAGSRRLSTGSRIVSGMSVTQQELLWTDLGLWAMTYLGSLAAGVWGFNQIGYSCGLIGKHAAARLGSNVYWMGESNFFVLKGSGVEAIPCTVWDSVFQNLNTAYQHKCVAWANTPFNEVFFCFPRASTSAVEPDFYVKYNVLEQVWDYGPLPRSAGIDQSIVGMPISATPEGLIYEHEVSPDADGQPINAYFVTGDAAMSEGQDNIFADWLLPDAKWSLFANSPSATLLITLYSKYYPGETPRVHGPYSVTSATKFINPRLRGRLLSMKVESNDLGSFWRLGGMRYRGAPNGRLP